MTQPHYLNRAQAAKATGKSEPTIDAYLKSGRLPNAAKIRIGKREAWQIPITDLVAAGLLDKVNPTTETPQNGTLFDVMTLPEQLKALQEIAGLRAENEQLRNRLADAERARQDLINAYAPRIETAQTQAIRRRFWSRIG
jgi:hypothetical protein